MISEHDSSTEAWSLEAESRLWDAHLLVPECSLLIDVFSDRLRLYPCVIVYLCLVVSTSSHSDTLGTRLT